MTALFTFLINNIYGPLTSWLIVNLPPFLWVCVPLTLWALFLLDFRCWYNQTFPREIPGDRR